MHYLICLHSPSGMQASCIHIWQCTHPCVTNITCIYMHFIYSTQFNHDANKVVTDRLINEVKANNPKFSKSDIRGKKLYSLSSCMHDR